MNSTTIPRPIPTTTPDTERDQSRALVLFTPMYSKEFDEPMVKKYTSSPTVLGPVAPGNSPASSQDDDAMEIE